MARRGILRKARVTMTIDPATVEALDHAVEAQGLRSRSSALEAALSYWLGQEKRRQIEREVEVYYRSLTTEEKREDREWVEFSSQQVGRRKD